MNRAWAPALALIGATALQAGLAPHLAAFGVVPNLLLLVVVTLAFFEGPVAGSVTGFVAGTLLDMLGTTVIGPWALVLAVVGYTAGMLGATTFAEGWRLPVVVVFAASLLAELTFWILLSVLGAGGPFRLALPLIAGGAVYNTALAVLFYPWLGRLLKQDRGMTEFRRLA